VSAFRNVSGVTLVELLIVVSIMMTLLGLVGGSTLAMMERAKAQSEVITIYSLVKKASSGAFSYRRFVQFKFDGRQLHILIDDKKPVTEHFEFLDFEEQNLLFNSNGIPSRTQIKIRVRGVEKVLDFSALFDSFYSRDVLLGEVF